MEITLKNLPQSQVELVVEITPAEQEPYLIKAAEELSTTKPMHGFRPGKVPYETAKKHYGEMLLLEVSMDRLVKQTYFKAVREKKLETVGPPKIDIEKTAPGNNVVYKATVALLPKITLPEWKKIKLQRQNAEIKDADVEKVIGDLRKMQAKEVLVDRAAGKDDKVMIDMNIFLGDVPVEGGQAKDHSVYLNEDYYIPGLADKLIASKKDDKLEFQLPFPENFYQKHLAGKNANFKIDVKGIYERNIAGLDDEFAKGLGIPTLEELKKTVRENLQMEATQKEEQRIEIEMLKKITDDATFEEMPAIIIDDEKNKMFAELKASLAERGLQFEDYLKNIKKTVEELAKDFSKGADERARTALMIREIARQEKVEVSPEEFQEELVRVRETYKDSPQIDERLASPELQDYIAHMLLNRKVLHLLKTVILGDAEHQHCDHGHCNHHHGKN